MMSNMMSGNPAGSPYPVAGGETDFYQQILDDGLLRNEHR